jgi:hypothetical protein
LIQHESIHAFGMAYNPNFFSPSRALDSIIRFSASHSAYDIASGGIFRAKAFSLLAFSGVGLELGDTVSSEQAGFDLPR